MNNKYQERKSKGLCIQCGNPARQDKTTCEKCGRQRAEAVSKWQSKSKKERQSKGLCSCGRPTLKNRRTCDTCNDKNKAWYYKRKELGLCSYCGNPVMENSTRCQECSNKLRKDKRELKLEVFEAYGGVVCACCGETIETFLTIDHINNDGNEHRKKIGRTSVYRWLKKQNFPLGYQVLCFNCNMGKQLNGGVCPHKE